MSAAGRAAGIVRPQGRVWLYSASLREGGPGSDVSRSDGLGSGKRRAAGNLRSHRMEGVVSRPGRIIGVVIPVPDALSRLANRVRRPYDPNFRRIGPHVTVLPPRAVRLTRREVREAVGGVAQRWPSFEVVLGAIDTFHPVMPVVFASLRSGKQEMERLHRKLSKGPLKGDEAFPYVPHLTLGQNLTSRRLSRALELSRKTFDAANSRGWQVDRLIVVERISEDIWLPHPPLALRSPRKPSR